MIEYIFIAFLQGLFEWLPISSSGQVMIVSTNFFGISPENAFSLAIWLHLGTTLAVILKFRDDFIKIVKSLVPKASNISENDIKKRNWIIYATLGTAITALPLYFVFKIIITETFTAFQGDMITLIISGLLMLTGIILLKTRKAFGKNTIESVPQTFISKDSFISGLVQGVSILPGISRSGVTVSTILFEKYNQDDALRLSFLMSVPAAIASIIVDIIFGEGSILGSLNFFTIIITTLTSFIVGYLTIEILLKVAQNIEFGYFCIIYGVIAFAIIIPFIIFS
ncbi:MAG: undecaprenyl-diphosphate phosphatase [Promethearchaeota archaeon]